MKAAAKFELLDQAPPVLARPLDLINGRSYAATWIWVREVETGKNGKNARATSATSKATRELLVVRDDGRAYGIGGDEPLSALGFEVRLNDEVQDEKVWRKSATDLYRKRKRTNVPLLFAHIADVFASFMDFKSSISDQRTMSEFSACAAFITWFLPAFAVIPYFWPTGEPGSGKTKWGMCWASLSYLGSISLSSGSFAAIRDLANYGAAIMFDDAESLSDPKRSDPRKRELLLAGNRRGATISLKERSAHGKWVTRRLNAYCPKSFTAISTPDPVLSSRTISIPLVRTWNGAKGNSDPADEQSWPHDRRHLQDLLWGAALHLLPEARRVWTEFDDEKTTVGREFEPWRAILAVARLIERHGVQGLEARMRALMERYRQQRPEIVGLDKTRLVIQGLLHIADISDISDVSQVSGDLTASASQVVDAIDEMPIVAGAYDDEIEDQWPNARSVGRILRRLRLRQERKSSRNRERRWRVSLSHLVGLARSYGIIRAQS